MLKYTLIIETCWNHPAKKGIHPTPPPPMISGNYPPEDSAGTRQVAVLWGPTVASWISIDFIFQGWFPQFSTLSSPATQSGSSPTSDLWPRGLELGSVLGYLDFAIGNGATYWNWARLPKSQGKSTRSWSKFKQVDGRLSDVTLHCQVALLCKWSVPSIFGKSTRSLCAKSDHDLCSSCLIWMDGSGRRNPSEYGIWQAWLLSAEWLTFEQRYPLVSHLTWIGEYPSLKWLSHLQ